jgi:rhodanese-related sulfurtransferase
MSLKNVDVQTAYRLQSDDGYIYVDVRSVPEYESGHAKGADNVPLLHLDAATRQMRPNPDFLSVMQDKYPRGTKLLIGCQMGGRSTQASQLLLSAGYEDVTNVQGGFGGARDPRTGQVIAEGWVDAGLPVEGEESPENG